MAVATSKPILGIFWKQRFFYSTSSSLPGLVLIALLTADVFFMQFRVKLHWLSSQSLHWPSKVDAKFFMALSGWHWASARDLHWPKGTFGLHPVSERLEASQSSGYIVSRFKKPEIQMDTKDFVHCTGNLKPTNCKTNNMKFKFPGFAVKIHFCSRESANVTNDPFSFFLKSHWITAGGKKFQFASHLEMYWL